MNEQNMPKTIVYSLNPKDYYSLCTLIGCFQGGIKGRMQFGSAWWFCDHRDGMIEQLKILGNLGMLSTSVGMLTDSRSFCLIRAMNITDEFMQSFRLMG